MAGCPFQLGIRHVCGLKPVYGLKPVCGLGISPQTGLKFFGAYFALDKMPSKRLLLVYRKGTWMVSNIFQCHKPAMSPSAAPALILTKHRFKHQKPIDGLLDVVLMKVSILYAVLSF